MVGNTGYSPDFVELYMIRSLISASSIVIFEYGVARFTFLFLLLVPSLVMPNPVHQSINTLLVFRYLKKSESSLLDATGVKNDWE